MTNKDIKSGARILLGASLIFAGIGHLTFARKEFRAQVPDVIPIPKDDTVVYSGFAEILLGTAIAAAPAQHRPTVGKIAAAFFTAVFPGNIAQYMNQRDGFGLDTNRKRLVRLFFQPVLIAWALGSTSSPKK
jgi:uncharacterized membrane protein